MFWGWEENSSCPSYVCVEREGQELCNGCMKGKKFFMLTIEGQLIQWDIIIFELLIILPPFLYFSGNSSPLRCFLCSNRWMLVSAWKFWSHTWLLSLFYKVPVSFPNHQQRLHKLHICEAQEPKKMLPLSQPNAIMKLRGSYFVHALHKRVKFVLMTH